MFRFSFSFCIFLLTSSWAFSQSSPKVVVSIAPLHSLVQGVMGETGDAELLVQGLASPHGFQLKPSQIMKLQKASLIFYVSDGFETFLKRSFSNLPSDVTRVSMVNKARLRVYKFRKSGAWGRQDYDAHDHHDGKDHEGHEFEDDPHVWLDPDNALEMVAVIAAELSLKNPEYAKQYGSNAAILIEKIKSTDDKIKTRLAPLKARPFAVFHDAFQYFEKQYRLRAVGSILIEPDENPSINRILEMRKKITESGAICLFKEPQFSDKLVRTVIEDTEVKIGTLDPIGTRLQAGTNLYVSLLEKMSEDMIKCLGS